MGYKEVEQNASRVSLRSQYYSFIFPIYYRECAVIVRFYFMANFRDLPCLFCTREKSMLLTSDQME